MISSGGPSNCAIGALNQHAVIAAVPIPGGEEVPGAPQAGKQVSPCLRISMLNQDSRKPPVEFAFAQNVSA